ncbi:MAG: DUF465 domain-containing protein [Deltaproteobacteria bacterium]|nr:DUF465 domain-containing protein [Deltaproteobacteria bacterium]MBI2974572.1 DUF465 domain-containing protein [Deltaproteobacteria bacterium]
MEQRDLELIQKFSSTDKALAELYKQHVEYEESLEKLENKSYLSVGEQMQRAELKKKKLIGKDKLEMILRKYRSTST